MWLLPASIGYRAFCTALGPSWDLPPLGPDLPGAWAALHCAVPWAAHWQLWLPLAPYCGTRLPHLSRLLCAECTSFVLQISSFPLLQSVTHLLGWRAVSLFADAGRPLSFSLALPPLLSLEMARALFFPIGHRYLLNCHKVSQVPPCRLFCLFCDLAGCELRFPLNFLIYIVTHPTHTPFALKREYRFPFLKELHKRGYL